MESKSFLTTITDSVMLRFVYLGSIHEQIASSSLMRAYAKGLGSLAEFYCYRKPSQEISIRGMIYSSKYYYRHTMVTGTNIFAKLMSRALVNILLLWDLCILISDRKTKVILHTSSPDVIFMMTLFARILDIKMYLYRTEVPSRLYNSSSPHYTYKFLYSQVLNFIAETHEAANIYKTVLPPRASMNVLRSAIDCEDILLSSRRSASERYIAFCGVVSSEPKDGLLVLIRSFALLNQLHPHVKFFIVGGIANREYFIQIESLIAELGLFQHVIVTGRVSRQEYVSYLVNATILVNGKSNECHNSCGLSSKIIEYLYTGNPVVLTASDEFSELLVDKEEALFVDKVDEHCFLDIFLWIFNHYKCAIEIGQRGKYYAQTNLSIQKISSQLLSILNEEHIKCI